MTTVSNPSGTPSVSYNASGTTIVSVTANGTTQATGTPIPAVCGHTVAIVTATGSPPANQAVVLPDAPEIGDVVELYGTYPDGDGDSGTNIIVFPSSGMAIGDNGENNSINVPTSYNTGAGALFRYVASNLWQVLGLS